MGRFIGGSIAKKRRKFEKASQTAPKILDFPEPKNWPQNLGIRKCLAKTALFVTQSFQMAKAIVVYPLRS